MAEFQLPKLATRVRFPSPAPNQSANFDTKTAFRFGGVFLRLCPETMYFKQPVENLR